MEIKILDEILEYLLYVQNQEKPYNVGNNDRDRQFLKYNKELFKAAIQKLLKDEYIFLGTNVKIEIINQTHIAGLYDITFEGIIFIKSGGYEQKQIQNKRTEKAIVDLREEQRRQSKTLVNLNRWLVFGAVIVAVDSILNILNFFDICFCKLQELFSN